LSSYVNHVPFSCSRLHRILLSFPTRRSSDLPPQGSPLDELAPGGVRESLPGRAGDRVPLARPPHRGTSAGAGAERPPLPTFLDADRKSTRLNSSHVKNSYAVFCLKKKHSVLK